MNVILNLFQNPERYMRKIKAFGAIDLLIGLLITTAIFMIGMNAMKGIKFQGSPADTRNIKEHVDAQVNEIEQMKQQSIDFQNEILKEAQ